MFSLSAATVYLGRTIAEAFIGDGSFNVYELNRGTRPPNAGITAQIKCDKDDRAEFEKALKSRTWDIVIDTILKATDLEFVIETLGTRAGHFIHTGSIGVYGDARRIPVCSLAFSFLTLTCFFYRPYRLAAVSP